MAKAKPILSKAEKDQLHESAKKIATDQVKLSKHDQAIIEQALKEAKMPVHLTDKDFKLGEGELDIRKLSPENTTQMMFRMLLLNIVYDRQLAQSLVDIMRLMMIILKKLGCDDIIKATDDLLEELKKRVSQDVNKEEKQETVKN